MKSLSKFICAALICAVLPQASYADLRQDLTKLRNHLVRRQFDAAEKLFKVLMKQHEGTRQITAVQSQHQLFGIYYQAAKKHLEAGRHWSSYADLLIARMEKFPQIATSMPVIVSRLLASFTAAKKPELAEDKLEQILKRVKQIGEKTGNDQVKSLVSAINGSKVLLLAQQKQPGPAKELLSKLYTEKEKQLADSPKKQSLIVEMIYLKDTRFKLASVTKSGEAKKYQDDLLNFVNEKVRVNADSPLVVRHFVTLNLQSLAQLMYTNPTAARAKLNKFEETIDGISSQDRQVNALINSARRNLRAYRSRIASAIDREKLIGQSSIPLEVESWTNGKPLTDKDLKGKVVLLDFWAVWCGPCIRTFPHLRAWQQKYGKEGLEIIGVTRYYSYGWNEVAKRPQRRRGISKDDEKTAMLAFAKHHKLTHRFAIAPDQTFAKKYKVTGIPQVVLIDRKGKIRLIRVGSGEANAKAVHAKIKELLAEK